MQTKSKIALLAAAIALAGCDQQGGGQQAQALPLVSAQNVETIEFQPSKSYIGRVEAVEDTEVTAQVTGYLQDRHFQEGQMVKKGDLLYTIEPSSFEAQVANAKAAVAQAEAALKKAQLDFERGKGLLPRGSISQSEFDALTAAQLGAEAQLAASLAQLNLAEVNLSYTEIRAPFDGRIADSKASKGDLVSPSAGVLTTLVSLDPVHAAFSVSERERLNLGIDKVKGDGSAEAESVQVRVELENGETFEHFGELDFLGNRINIQTGTIAMRAVVPNPDQQLLPGQHIKVRLLDRETADVTVVPRRAVQTDLEGNFVMVLAEGDIAERRNVELGTQVEEGVIIQSGIEPTDKVITQGLQRIRNGVPVRLQEAQAE
ncbi:efflux RND transporter periplasmic adaptor subunit [Vibrio agarivorans]|uniref:Efflux RND transporter periplasmic adaptor subunit n=1 Tax=Vibrio agarivorans TaxID=153622 RepID=A0ABT7Y699_9VIBR|nr:efflux RND transporter periplasmic adaptor subunit [Vibrio agarivorans]MDN2483582.1 efflux RND transporter periplasmic adaptor subunit [Vibrio agarivorans]